MKNLIAQIHRDHVNMARLLKLIESEIEAMASEEPRNLEVLDDTLRYMINYADKIHHAKEDVIFRRLQEVAPDTRGLVDDILEEHKDLADKGAEFYDLVQAAEYGDFVLRDKIVAAGKDYVGTLYAHMSKEEDSLLKRAEQVLTDEDAEELGLDTGADKDPLFGEQVLKEYHNLYQYILHQYGNDWLHPAHRVV